MKIFMQRLIKPASLLYFNCIACTSLPAQDTSHPLHNPPEIQVQANNHFRQQNLTYKITTAVNGTFCYDIFTDGRLMIHQNSIPALPGNKGFEIRTDAEKVAHLVILKIKNGEMPPTVTINEMKDLNILLPRNQNLTR